MTALAGLNGIQRQVLNRLASGRRLLFGGANAVWWIDENGNYCGREDWNTVHRLQQRGLISGAGLLTDIGRALRERRDAQPASQEPEASGE